MREHATLSDEDKGMLEGRFPTTTLDRLLSTLSFRSRIGFEFKDSKLLSVLPPEEAIKPLRRIVLDLARGTENVTKSKLVSRQVGYIGRFAKSDMPDLTKKGDAVPAAGKRRWQSLQRATRSFPAPAP